VGTAWWASLTIAGSGTVASTSVVCVAVALVHWVTYERAGLYHARVIAERTAELSRLVRCTAGIGLGVGLATRAQPLFVPIATVAGATLFTAVVVATGRGALRAWLTTQRTRGRFRRPVALVGVGPETEEVYDLLSEHPELGFDAVAVLGERAAADRVGLGHLWRDSSQGIGAALADIEVTGVFVIASCMDPVELNQTTRELLGVGLRVQVVSHLTGFASRRLQVRTLAYRQVIDLEPLELSPWQVTAKRCTDVVVAALVLVPTSFVIGVCALLIRLGDGGPALFRQTRIGQDGRPFSVLKLRTMVIDAEQRKQALVDESNERAGPLFKMERDPRLTRVGYWLDLTSLNELPQLWNVLRGDMSLVGPRPALPEEHQEFDPALQARTVVRPGITGLWQVEARDNASFEAYRRFDLHYVENWSISLDAVILVATAEAVIARVLRQLTGRGTAALQPNPPREPPSASDYRSRDADRRQRTDRRRGHS